MQIETIIRSIVQDELAKLLREYQLVPIQKNQAPVQKTPVQKSVSLLDDSSDDNIPF